MAWPTPRRTYLFVESSEGRLRKAAEDVWRVIHSSAPELRPKLDSLVLLDEGLNDEIARGRRFRRIGELGDRFDSCLCGRDTRSGLAGNRRSKQEARMALMSRSINEARISHDRLFVEVQRALERNGWTVSPEPRLAGLRPDIVARDPHGNNYVIEIKAGAGRAHLGGVAQVEMYRNSLKSQLGDAKGVLILGGDVPEQLAAVAERAGVELIDASAEDDSPGSLASSLASLAQTPRS